VVGYRHDLGARGCGQMIQGIARMICLSSLVNHDHHEKLSHVQGQTVCPTDPKKMSSHESKKEGAEKSAKTDLG